MKVAPCATGPMIVVSNFWLSYSDCGTLRRLAMGLQMIVVLACQKIALPWSKELLCCSSRKSVNQSLIATPLCKCHDLADFAFKQVCQPPSMYLM
eukprot:14184959-Ditylum_brightwellii.AAC.1